MKQSKQFSDAIHIMTYIALTDDPKQLKSEKIADSVKTNASNIRRIMGNLRKAGLLCNQQGDSKNRLSRQSKDITLLDIYKSLPGDNPLLQIDNDTNLNCIVGGNIQNVLAEKYAFLQLHFEKELDQLTLADIITDLLSKARAKGESLEDIKALL